MDKSVLPSAEDRDDALKRDQEAAEQHRLQTIHFYQEKMNSDGGSTGVGRIHRYNAKKSGSVVGLLSNSTALDLVLLAPVGKEISDIFKSLVNSAVDTMKNSIAASAVAAHNVNRAPLTPDFNIQSEQVSQALKETVDEEIEQIVEEADLMAQGKLVSLDPGLRHLTDAFHAGQMSPDDFKRQALEFEDIIFSEEVGDYVMSAERLQKLRNDFDTAQDPHDCASTCIHVFQRAAADPAAAAPVRSAPLPALRPAA
jgi:hypothetical protein